MGQTSGTIGRAKVSRSADVVLRRYRASHVPHQTAITQKWLHAAVVPLTTHSHTQLHPRTNPRTTRQFHLDKGVPRTNPRRPEDQPDSSTWSAPARWNCQGCPQSDKKQPKVAKKPPQSAQRRSEDHPDSSTRTRSKSQVTRLLTRLILRLPQSIHI